MKKNLKVTGEVVIDRDEIISIITEHIQKKENLQVEKTITVDGYGHQIAKPFNKMVFTVFKDDTKIDAPGMPTKRKYTRRAKKTAKKKSIRRPNYGIGKELKQILGDGKEHKFEDIAKVVKPKFPKLTNKALKEYLGRTDILGGPVIEADGLYLRMT